MSFLSYFLYQSVMWSYVLLDVIGFFTGVGAERQYERNGVSTKMNVIELESEGYFSLYDFVVLFLLL